MFGLRSLVTLLLLVGWSALADSLPGSADPAFQSAWARLLDRDDPAALIALHDLAATGNTAALLALPLADRWLPATTVLPATELLPDRRALREVDGRWVPELGQEAFKAAELWRDGTISPVMADQLDRALGLYGLSEYRKADALLKAWFNHMPQTAPLPEGLTELNAAPENTALILLQHLTRGDRKALAPLQYLLDQDLIEGWMVLAELTDHYPVTSGPPIQANLRLGSNIATRLVDGRRALRLLWQEEPTRPVPQEAVDMAMRDLMPRPQFEPVRVWCASRCVATASACEAAFVGLLGAPMPSMAQLTPFADLMGAAAFFATPRGEQVLLSAAVRHNLALDLAPDASARLSQDPAWQAARSTDACLAGAALHALDPFPAVP